MIASKFIFIVPISFIALATAVSLQAASIDTELRQRLQKATDSVQQAERIQGVTAAVMIEGDIWQGAAGMSSAMRPMMPDMVLGIGSNTKTCTAITLLRLQEQGKIDLDVTIDRWFPNEPNIDGRITVRQLLNHTSGLGDYSGQRYRDSTLANLSRVWKSRELLAYIPPKLFEAGTSWSYSNSNYLLAGIIAQEVTGLSLYQLYRRELFNPLSMDSTRLYPDEVILGELANRWMGGRDASNNQMTAEWSGAWAAGAVIAPAAEMAQLYDALFSGRVLNEQSMAQLVAFVGSNNYGLGISLKRVGGETVIGHSGEIRGYSSVILRVPSLKANIVVLTNSIPSNPIAIASALIREIQRGPTSIDQTEEAHGPISFPCTVSFLDGRHVAIAHTKADLQCLPSGVYLTVCRENAGIICVAPDGIWRTVAK